MGFHRVSQEANFGTIARFAIKSPDCTTSRADITTQRLVGGLMQIILYRILVAP